MKFSETEIEDHYIKLITDLGLGFVEVRAVPYGSSFTFEELTEWVSSTPFCLFAIGAEDFESATATHKAYRVKPQIVIAFGNVYDASSMEFRTFRDTCVDVVKRKVAGVQWQTAEGQQIIPNLKRSFLSLREPSTGLILYVQEYEVNTLIDSDQ